LFKSKKKRAGNKTIFSNPKKAGVKEIVTAIPPKPGKSPKTKGKKPNKQRKDTTQSFQNAKREKKPKAGDPGGTLKFKAMGERGFVTVTINGPQKTFKNSSEEKILNNQCEK